MPIQIEEVQKSANRQDYKRKPHRTSWLKYQVYRIKCIEG